ncbi:MAG: aldo/keto reductase [Planctomycetaceae bacterium]|nr:aldo/keto reductase [Planctomycetaceae bacterium]
MQYHQLGTTDLRVSSLGMGCVTFGREIDRDTSFRILDHAIDRGINLLDTAAAYANGASESVLGDWMTSRGTRDRVVLATKVSGTLTRDTIIASAEESLERLQTDRIDLLQLHHWSEETPLEDSLAGLTTLVEQGKVRSIGCSNFCAWQLCKALLLMHEQGAPKMQSVQPPYNLVQREIEAEVLPLCADQQIGVLSYSPLAAGFLTGKYLRGGEVPRGTRFDVIPGHQSIYFTDHGFAVLDRLQQVAFEQGRSAIQLALAWAIGRPRITSTLIGARTTAHVDQAFEAEQAGLDPDVAHLLEDIPGIVPTN